VLVVLPTAWDARQLEACRPAWEDRFEVVWAEPSDVDCPADFDPGAFVEHVVAGAHGALDGVLSSSDYPGATVAGAIATRLGLPGSPPASIVRASHKYYSRLAQREAVPEATVAFDLVRPEDPTSPAVGFPCFVKPVKGAYSVCTRRVDSRAELDAFLKLPAVREYLGDYMGIFNRIVRAFTDFEIDGGWLLAEELVGGQQVTVEGWADGGEIVILGVVDSVRHPETGSFLRFVYPSALPAPVQRRMGEIASRVVAHLGLRHSLFNIEMSFQPEADRISIIEVNPRLCGQFADLYAKVDGRSSYEVALALAVGERPAPPTATAAGRAAASFPLRIFEPARVARAPDAARIAAVEARWPGTLVWSECATGDRLDDFESAEDGRSFRYAVVNLGAPRREALEERLQAVTCELGFAFERV
jgi:biotin carboxylase